MLRKQARERRDYLYRRALLLKESEIAEKRARLRDALASGKRLDKKYGQKDLIKHFQYDESAQDLSKEELLDLDDEYSNLSGMVEPRVLLTTSRDPSSRLMTFSKEARLLFPTGLRLNRGNLILDSLVASCKSNALTDLILVHEHRGVPTAMTISHLPHGPTLCCSLHDVLLRTDVPNSIRGTVSESYPHLIFEGFTTQLGRRVVKILKHLFPPRDPVAAKGQLGNRVITFYQNNDCIMVRHHVYVRTGFDSVELSEVGPRFTMRPFELRQSTLENKDGDVEWHLNTFTRTAKKKDHL